MSTSGPDSVFEEGARTDARPRENNEPTFAFLDRRAGASWQRVRELVNDWYRHAPERARGDVRSRLTSRSDNDFRSAFFELYCIEVLRRAGWQIEVHPKLSHTSRRPDFRADRDGTSVYFEATITAPAEELARAEKRLNTLLDGINARLVIAGFMLGVDVISIGTTAAPIANVCGRIQAWLDDADPDKRLLTAGHGPFASLDWREGD